MDNRRDRDPCRRRLAPDAHLPPSFVRLMRRLPGLGGPLAGPPMLTRVPALLKNIGEPLLLYLAGRRRALSSPGSTSEPETTPGIPEAEREAGLEEGAVPHLQEGVEDHDLELLVELEERTQDVRLVPRASLLDPVPWILEGVEDVVEVNQDPRPDPREDVEEDPVDVAADLGDMGRIDEEDVVRLERAKESQGNVLEPERIQLHPLQVSGKQELLEQLRIRLDAGDPDRPSEESVAGVQRDASRMPGADLQDPPRLELPDHAMVEDRVAVRVRGVLETVPQPRWFCFPERLLLVEAIPALEELELRLLPEIDPRNRFRVAGRDPRPFFEHGGDVRQRAVEVAGGNEAHARVWRRFGWRGSRRRGSSRRGLAGEESR